MGGEGSGRRPDPMKTIFAPVTPIAMQGDNFIIPNNSGVRKYQEQFKQIDLQFIDTISGTTSGLGVAQSVTIPAGTFEATDILEFVWHASTNATTGAAITIGWTSNSVTTTLAAASIATGSRGMFQGHLAQGIEATDIGIIMHRGVTASGSQIGSVAEGDTNLANWITGSFTINVTPNGGDIGSIYWSLSVYKRRG